MYSIVKEKIYDIVSRVLRIKKAYAIGYKFNDAQNKFLFHKELPYTVILPTKDEWYADPFPWVKDGKHYIFAEIMKEKNKGRGTLGVTCLETDGGKFKEILSESFHLSFPNVFEIDDKIYMIPETNQANQIRLYEALGFPNVWRFKSVLLEGICCADTVIYHEQENIYLVTYDLTKATNRIFLWDYKNSVLSEIETKKKTYIDRRPAGNFIHYSNGLYHALQNCDATYGKHLHIAKVHNFDKTGLYETEEMIYTVKDVSCRPKKFFDRIHTFNRVGNFEVIDLHFWQISFKFGGRNDKKYSV